MRDDQYGYDASGNVTSILDLLPSNVSNRSMTYDGLDRLKTVTAPNLWGTATYGYDVLDNLISTTITAGISARNTLHNINATTTAWTASRTVRRASTLPMVTTAAATSRSATARCSSTTWPTA